MKGMKTAAKEKMTRLLLATMAWLLALVLWPSFSWAASPDVTTALQPTFDIHAYDVDANKNSKRHYAVGNFFYQVEYWFDGLEGESAQGFTQLIYDSCVRSAERTILDLNGSTIRSESSYDNPYGYTSRRHDEETGLCYFRARYYDPATGEFISQDPLEYVDGPSLYRGYFGINGVDPLGLDDICTPEELANALAYHWFYGNNENFTKGSKGLKADVDIRKAAKNELKFLFFELCNRILKDGETKTGSFVKVIKPQPLNFWLRQSTNIPSVGFRLRIAYEATKKECCCSVKFDVSYIWQDVADIHPEKHFPDSWMYYWHLYGLMDGEYEIIIPWEDSSFMRRAKPDGECLDEETGWPFEPVVVNGESGAPKTTLPGFGPGRPGRF